MLELTLIIGFVLDNSCVEYLLFLAEEEVKWKDCAARFSVTAVFN